MPLAKIGNALLVIGGRIMTACCCQPPPPPDGYRCEKGSCIPSEGGPFATIEECQRNCRECERDGDCPPGLKCCDGKCCQCCDGQPCLNGRPCTDCMCEPDCDDAADCGPCQVCLNGRCSPCPSGWECIDGECWPPERERYYCCTQTTTGLDGSQVSQVRCQKGPCLDGLTWAGGPYRTYAQCCESGCGCRYKCDPGSGECSPEEQGQYDELQKCREACEPPGERGACCETIPPGHDKNKTACAVKQCAGETKKEDCKSSDGIFRVWKRGMKCNTCPDDEKNVCCKPKENDPCEVECFVTCTKDCEDQGGTSNARFRSCTDEHPLFGTPPCKPIKKAGAEGACCFPDNKGCGVVPECQCKADGGEFKGEGTKCVDGQCVPFSGPCTLLKIQGEYGTNPNGDFCGHPACVIDPPSRTTLSGWLVVFGFESISDYFEVSLSYTDNQWSGTYKKRQYLGPLIPCKDSACWIEKTFSYPSGELISQSCAAGDCGETFDPDTNERTKPTCSELEQYYPSITNDPPFSLESHPCCGTCDANDPCREDCICQDGELRPRCFQRFCDLEHPCPADCAECNSEFSGVCVPNPDPCAGSLAVTVTEVFPFP